MLLSAYLRFTVFFFGSIFAVVCLSGNPARVVITGAGSSVGLLTFKRLMREQSFIPIGLVRDRKGYVALKSIGARDDQIRFGDITKKETLNGKFDDVSKVIMCTSARPIKKISFVIKDSFRKLIGNERPARTSDLYYHSDQTPYYVDFIGQKNTIDACVRSKVDHIVLLGNMGGYRGSKQNDIGRSSVEDDPRTGNILKWKRASERYLMKRCFFTIVHAGALTNEKGGYREIVWDTDDALLRTNFRKIPREDVAEVLVQALIWKESIGRSIDIGSRPEGKGPRCAKDW